MTAIITALTLLNLIITFIYAANNGVKGNLKQITCLSLLGWAFVLYFAYKDLKKELNK